jgi:hypothetical protein
MDRRLLTVVRAGSVVLVVAAMLAAIAALVDEGRFDPTRFFAFFTIDSNVIGVAAFVWLIVARGAPRS